jgi:hypothetical protein
MSVVTLYPAIAGDDVCWQPGGSFHTGAYPELSICYDHAGHKASTYIRFPNVTIPAGAQILSASLVVTSKALTALTGAKAKIYANDIDTSVAPTGTAEGDALVLTTAFILWEPGSWSADSAYGPSDIASVVQEVISRGGWESGNALGIVITENSGDNRSKYIWSVDDADAAKYATLVITYNDNPSLTGITFPVFTLSSTGFHTDSNTMTLPVPVLEAEGKQGATVEGSIPALTISAYGQVAPVGTLDVDLPIISISAEVGNHGEIAADLSLISVEGRTGEAIECTFPAITATGLALHGAYGILDTSMPELTAVATGLSGETGDFSGTLPKMTISSTLHFLPAGTLDSDLPSLFMRSTAYSSDRFVSTVLRYSRP